MQTLPQKTYCLAKLLLNLKSKTGMVNKTTPVFFVEDNKI